MVQHKAAHHHLSTSPLGVFCAPSPSHSQAYTSPISPENPIAQVPLLAVATRPLDTPQQHLIPGSPHPLAHPTAASFASLSPKALPPHPTCSHQHACTNVLTGGHALRRMPLGPSLPHLCVILKDACLMLSCHSIALAS